MTKGKELSDGLGVTPAFDVDSEITRRVSFLADYLRSAACRTYVLGISGGVDSLAAGLLTQRAVKGLRASGYDASFMALRLPYGVQLDEAHAQEAVVSIQPDRLITIDIRPAADAMIAQLEADAPDIISPASRDFLLGNVKARQRMIAQYTIAGASHGLVIGTDHAAEAVMGFFTKYGDGAADVLPLAGLNKRRVRAIASRLGAPDNLVFKISTADLETDAPQRPDEAVYGVTYEEIDDFLEGKTVAASSREFILQAYRATTHKRALPAIPRG